MFPASNPVGSLNQNRRAKGIPFDSYSSGSALGGGRRPSFIQTEVQGLPDRLFPYRHRGGPNRSGQALSHPRPRPDLEFAFVELHEKVARRTARHFLRRLIAAVPYKVDTILTDKGTHFTTPAMRVWPRPTSRYRAARQSEAISSVFRNSEAKSPIWSNACQFVAIRLFCVVITR